MAASRSRRYSKEDIIHLFQNLSDSDESDSSDSDFSTDSHSSPQDNIDLDLDRELPSASGDSPVDLLVPSTSRENNSDSDRPNRSRSRSPVNEPSTSGASRGNRGNVRARRGRPRGITRPRIQPVPRDDWHRTDRGETANDFSFTPRHGCGVLDPTLNQDSSALDHFFSLYTQEVIDKLIDSINKYAKHKVMINTPATKRSVYGNWTDVTRPELLVYFAVLISIGIKGPPEYRNLWALSPKYNYTPWYHEAMARERFEAIHFTMLHCGETEAESVNKIQPFMNSLLSNFQKAFYPFQKLSLDEMVIGWKGRFKYRQFNSSKPDKFHIKMFGLCDSQTGYTYNLLGYFGTETFYDPESDPDSSSAIRVFQTLLTPLIKGHHIYADRYYTTRALIEYLIQRQTYYTGTFQTNRVGFPPEIKERGFKLGFQEKRYWMNDSRKILSVAWRDKKAKTPCLLASTQGSVEDVEIQRRRETQLKPSVIHNYNMNMNGCDRTDQRVKYYGLYERKTRKWWKKLFHWLFEVAQSNAYVLYNLTRPAGSRPRGLLDFKNKLFDQFAELSASINHVPRVVPPTFHTQETHILAKTREVQHLVMWVPGDRRCAHCSTPEVRKRTHFICTGCPNKPHLHPKDCFLAFHAVP